MPEQLEAVAPAIAGVSAPPVAATTPRDNVPAAPVAAVVATGGVVATTDRRKSLSRGYTHLAPLPIEVR